jgi:5'-nucleotidase
MGLLLSLLACSYDAGRRVSCPTGHVLSVKYNGPVSLQLLLTNDDGIASPGIAALRRALEGLGEVTTLAPLENSSAVARSITIDRALRVERTMFGDGFEGLALDGTPSDCVRVALLGVVTPVPDLVVSGINLGANLGADVTYSGTVGAALEAALRGGAGIALSVESREPGWLDEAVPLVRAILSRAIEHGVPSQTVLNVNLPDSPASAIRGVRPARLGGASCHDRVTLAGDGAGEYFVPCDGPPSAPGIETDFEVVAAGCVALTPLRYDLLDAGLLADLDAWDLDLESVRG